VICDDKWSDPRYRYLPELGGERYTSMASVPLVSPRGKLVGAVNIHTEARREFEDDDVAFLERVATLVAAAIEHVELFRELASTERALQALMTRSVQAQEEERRRLAAEIHDGVTQHLVSAWYRVHGAQRRFSSDPALAAADLAEAKRLIDEALAEARTAIHALRPGMLDDLGLVPSLEALARTATEAGVPAEIDARLDTPLPEHLELAVYRIVQEALTNVRKHACASRVEVRLRCEGAAVELSVSDDGVGFDVERYRLAHSQTSFGLAGISERVELVGGSLDVTSEPGAGTTVRVRVPLERAEART
jgi:signal transduction histidine kinase